MTSVRKYQAATMKEALLEVKKDLGQDAVILGTRTVRDKGLFGLFGKPVVEVTAAQKGEASPSPAPGGSAPVRGTERLLRRAYGGGESTSAGEPAAPGRRPDSTVHEIESALSQIKALVAECYREVKYKDLAGLPDALLDVYNGLREVEIGDSIAQRLVRHLAETLSAEDQADRSLVRTRLERIVRELVDVTGPVGSSTDPRPAQRKTRVISLVGPTGVGKTTTIAKLAAHFALTEGKSVALATLDTYRIAAVEQLGQYAQLMGLPVKVVNRPVELRDVLAGYADKDLVFLDTAGRSQRDRLKMEDLKDFIEIASPDEVHLVVSATTHVRNSLDIARRFAEVGFDRLLVTKLDEAPHYGFLLDLALSVRKPFSYLTTGQGVPNNIEVATRPGLASFVLGLGKESSR